MGKRQRLGDRAVPRPNEERSRMFDVEDHTMEGGGDDNLPPFLLLLFFDFFSFFFFLSPPSPNISLPCKLSTCFAFESRSWLVPDVAWLLSRVSRSPRLGPRPGAGARARTCQRPPARPPTLPPCLYACLRVRASVCFTLVLAASSIHTSFACAPQQPQRQNPSPGRRRNGRK